MRPLYILPDRPGRHMKSSSIFERIFFPNRDIDKRVAFSGIIDLSPRPPSLQNGHQARCQGQGSQNGLCPLLHAYPCKTPSQIIRLARQESDITSL
ncbi:hypothetical protein AVEN_106981-1 [Araneus ventricosus]|uniref:Uncharacterized protein n=1 Tax=Araneus ventricosus TaxID=182803 RepID=A0A4Y2PMD1_ARAVE|nr:hypothetical protein AVEN_106981-1 [Araneus ventricosus]